MQKGDSTGAVGVIFDTRNLGRNSVLLALKVDDSVLLLVATTAVTRGLAAVVVTPAYVTS